MDIPHLIFTNINILLVHIEVDPILHELWYINGVRIGKVSDEIVNWGIQQLIAFYRHDLFEHRILSGLLYLVPFRTAE